MSNGTHRTVYYNGAYWLIGAHAASVWQGTGWTVNKFRLRSRI